MREVTSAVKRQEVEVLFDNTSSEMDDAGDELDVVELGGENCDRLEVTDVALDGFFGVIVFLAGSRDQGAFEAESDPSSDINDW